VAGDANSGVIGDCCSPSTRRSRRARVGCVVRDTCLTAALAEGRIGLYRYSVRGALTAGQRRPLVASRMAARPG
jgi:hypothetical protein